MYETPYEAARPSSSALLPPHLGQQSPTSEMFGPPDRALEELERQIEVLTNRLTPVLRMQETPSAEQPHPIRKPSVTPLAEMIAQRVDRLDASLARLDRIIHLIGL
jgi:hypothetical protein